MWHWLKRGLRSWNDWLRSSWQRNTGGLSSLRKTHLNWRNQTVACYLTCHVSGVGSRSMNISSDTCISRPSGTRGAQRASSIGPSGNSAGAVACRTKPLLHFTVVVRCANHSDSCCKPMTVEGPCQCAAHSRFACPLPLQQYKISSTWKSCQTICSPMFFLTLQELLHKFFLTSTKVFFAAQSSRPLWFEEALKHV